MDQRMTYDELKLEFTLAGKQGTSNDVWRNMPRGSNNQAYYTIQ